MPFKLLFLIQLHYKGRTKFLLSKLMIFAPSFIKSSYQSVVTPRSINKRFVTRSSYQS